MEGIWYKWIFQLQFPKTFYVMHTQDIKLAPPVGWREWHTQLLPLKFTQDWNPRLKLQNNSPLGSSIWDSARTCSGTGSVLGKVVPKPKSSFRKRVSQFNIFPYKGHRARTAANQAKQNQPKHVEKWKMGRAKPSSTTGEIPLPRKAPKNSIPQAPALLALPGPHPQIQTHPALETAVPAALWQLLEQPPECSQNHWNCDSLITKISSQVKSL